MGRTAIFVITVMIVSLLSIAAVHAGKGNAKISNCLKTKSCKFIVVGTATEDPKMSFLVLEKIWKSFTTLDRNDLKRVLKAKITEANEKPERYIHLSKKAPSYDRLKRNVENMRSYSVFLSYGKNGKGNLQLDQEILINY
jgi:hypothetical protein